MKLEGSYSRTISHDGTTVTICENRFEISTRPLGEVFEQQSVQMLKEWIRWRKAQEELRESGGVPTPAPQLDMFGGETSPAGT